MRQDITLHVNGKEHTVNVEPDTPLIYILRNDLGLKGVKAACGLEQCGACDVIVDSAVVPSCQLEVHKVQGLAITTIEGLGTPDHLHPLQEAFIEEQAIQCGYCAPGMIVAAQGLLNRTRYPSDAEIREALADNLCRCGVHDRIRRAIKRRIARPDARPLWEVIDGESTEASWWGSGNIPPSLQRTPELDAWLRVNADQTITLFAGKVEYGQGIKTVFAQLVAEEMDAPLDCIRVITADSALTPDEGNTVGSMSLESTGNAIRVVAAEARHFLLNLAFEELEAASVEQLVVEDATVTDPDSGRRTTYWSLMGGKLFGQQVSGRVRPKTAATYHVVGEATKRVDLLDKVTGQGCFVQDLDLPNMVYGRVVRPPAYHAHLIDVDTDAICQMEGVLQVVQDGDFLGVIAEREEQAERAAETLRQAATWETGDPLPLQETLFEDMLEQAGEAFPVVEGTAAAGQPIPAITQPDNAAQTIRATHTRPFHMHASLAPSAGAAQWNDEGNKLTVWTHSQGVFPLRAAIASALHMAEENIRVIQVEGSGCYGHNGADDAAFDAVLLARALPGRPVLVRWSRADENQWEPYGPAMVIQMQASLGADGNLLDWNHDVWSYAHLGRARPDATTSGLLAAWHMGEGFEKPEQRPALFTHVGSHRNADPLYSFPNRRIVKHFVPDSPLRTSSFRGLGAYANVFAIESFVDELAHAAGFDPVVFRLHYLDDERARAVIEAAAEKASWGSDKPADRDGFGRGMAFARYKNRAGYAAVVVELTVDRTSGEIQLERAVIAADSGQIVNPDGLSNQLEGGFVQAASMTLKERVTWDGEIVTSVDWESYPISRFADVPILETVLINRPGSPFLGSGEMSTGPTPAAIANAVYDAVGARLRDLPFLPERVRAAIERTG